jgi:hypothetical protein
VDRLKATWSRLTLSETLKKSIASQVHASHLEKGELDKAKRAQSFNPPREEKRPLNKRETTERLEQRLLVFCLLTTGNEVPNERGGHGGEMG